MNKVTTFLAAAMLLAPVAYGDDLREVRGYKFEQEQAVQFGYKGDGNPNKLTSRDKNSEKAIRLAEQGDRTALWLRWQYFAGIDDTAGLEEIAKQAASMNGHTNLLMMTGDYYLYQNNTEKSLTWYKAAELLSDPSAGTLVRMQTRTLQGEGLAPDSAYANATQLASELARE